jgi:hypothetical protein
MNAAELADLTRNGENSGVEFKRDDIRPEGLAKEMAALLNFEGGYILLGVEDDGEHEHLVVELKAPKMVIGDTEITQIKNYARMVARDPRFDRLQVQWDFVIVSTELDENAKADASQTNRERGLVWEQEGIRVWARTWAEIIDEAEYRLNFVKERLGYALSDELALDYLRRTHAQFVPESLRSTEPTASASG